jgi:hypothetical protein
MGLHPAAGADQAFTQLAGDGGMLPPVSGDGLRS